MSKKQKTSNANASSLTADAIRTRTESLESNFRWLEFDDNSTPKPPIDPDTWLEIGPRLQTIDQETKFCDGEILREVLQLRSSLDDRDQQEVRWARNRSNPFDVKAGQFMTRAAVKIANVDAIFGWQLCQRGESDNLMYFVDVFGGPGGCSEYVLWRNDGWNAKGFGFSTKGDYEFHPEMFRMGAPESFDPFYGANDEGNIFDPENVASFVEYVKSQTDRLGAHLIMCDGGFFVKNNCQEIISKQLYLCLVLLAVAVIRPGGNAILKVFDLYTSFSVGLVYILTKSYGKVSIVKPASSRPANSERYLVCQNRLNRESLFARYLMSINQVLWENKHCDHDIIHLVSPKTMQEDTDFYNFIRNSNEDLARKQIAGLKALIDNVQGVRPAEKVDRQLVQDTLWRQWKLDHKSRISPTDGFAKCAPDYALECVGKTTLELFESSDTPLCGKRLLKKTFGNPNDWFFMPVDVTADQGRSIRTVFLSKGNGNVFCYDREKANWTQIKDYQVVLSPRTVLYGEIVEEISAKGEKQKIVHALHIIDAILLGGQEVRGLPLDKRNILCCKFAKAMNRPLSHQNSSSVRPIPVRCKTLLPMMELDSFFSNVSIHELINGAKVIGSDLDSFDAQESKRFYIPRGLLFVRSVQTASKGAEKQLDFGKAFASRILWAWSKTSQIYSSAQRFDVAKEPNLVYRQDFDEFIEKCGDKK
ncbi:cap-specific mRNA (nucleoside-2'-O-)-methyltransferase 1 [Aedes aegypti]|uniref:Cap-specific mRNA (nucleoside-2'-O-)-methyltransferase 1 n=1 Tax=Aedes aegypti TaxID=7159 RepID=A0A1S4G004_AEDAE|nr:cap-specific mRNA (nucleoside-2'-O-)-methyltransferase 1 [Aedes aegypti]